VENLRKGSQAAGDSACSSFIHARGMHGRHP
jgi:hypothetical protein